MSSARLSHRHFTLLVAVLLFVGACFPSVCVAGDYYAAIAFSFKTTHYGYSYGKTSRADAERLAIANTKARDAKIVVVARNAWCALVQSKRGNGAGTGVSVNKSEAIAAAYRNCPDVGGKKLTTVIFAGQR